MRHRETWLVMAMVFLVGCKDDANHAATAKATDPPTSAASPAPGSATASGSGSAASSSEPPPRSAGAATPAPPTVASAFPACKEVGTVAVEGKVDAAAKAMIESFEGALAANDAAKVAPLLAARVRLDKTTQDAAAVVARLAKDGPQAVTGFEPNELFDTSTNTKRCVWQFGIAPGKTGLELYTGSGYGMTHVAEIANTDGSWKIISIETKDYGPP